MKRAHIEKVKKANKLVTKLWAMCVVLAIIGLAFCTLFMIPNIKYMYVVAIIVVIDIIAVVLAIIAASLRRATEDFEFEHRDDID